MHYEGMFEVKAPRNKVFEFLTDPKGISRCLPDLQKLEVKDRDHFVANIKVGMGFIKGDFSFNFVFLERLVPSRARLKARGSGSGSSIDMDTVMELSDAGKAGTKMAWKADAQIGGLLAGVGQRLIEGAASKTINQLFDCLRAQLEKK
jgi:carbon monoxide dehydrogenase subunit G